MYGYNNFDKISYDIGMIECFCEMVAARVKTLALSPAIEPKHFQVIKDVVTQISEKYKIKFYIEDDMILNNIAPESYTDGKYVFFFYMSDEIIDEYLSLKKTQEEAIKSNTYSSELRKNQTIKLCRILSYPEKLIEEKYM